MGDPSGELVVKAGASCFGGALLYVTAVVVTMRRRHLHDTSDLRQLRELVLCGRIVLGGFIALLFPLFFVAASKNYPVVAPMTSLSDGGSWNFGWGRPCVHLTLAFVGTFLDHHPAARISCILGMALAIFLDSLSSYNIGAQLQCVSSAKCALPGKYTARGLIFLRARDHISLLLATWALLLACHLSRDIGMRHIRYPLRRLHQGDYNRVEVMRAELAKSSG